MKYIVSVSKTYIRRGNHKHKPSTKKHWHIYYYEDGKFKTKRVNTVQALFYKTQKRKRMKYICTECGGIFLGWLNHQRIVWIAPIVIKISVIS